MLRKVACAAAVLVFSVGLALAEDYQAVIKKIDGNKITLAKVEGKKGDVKVGEDKTLTVSKNVKVVKGKFNKEEKKLEAGDALEGGLANKMFTSIGDKGVRARVTVDGDQVTQIMVFQGKFGKKKKNNN